MTTPKATEGKLSADRLAEIQLIWERGNTAVPVGSLLRHIAAIEAENQHLLDSNEELQSERRMVPGLAFEVSELRAENQRLRSALQETEDERAVACYEVARAALKEQP